MDKYVMAVLMLLPGFLAIGIAEKLGKAHAKKTGVSLVLGYAAYTIVILLVTMGILSWTSDPPTLQQVVNGEMQLSFYAAMVLVSVVASIVSGAVWSIFLSDWVLDRCNAINVARGRNLRWEDSSLFHHLFNDGQWHFLIVQKDEKDIAVGFFCACGDPQNEKDEFSVAEYPEYREEWERVKKGEKDSYLYRTKQTYVDASSGLVITETEYPPEWIDGDLKKAS